MTTKTKTTITLTSPHVHVPPPGSVAFKPFCLLLNLLCETARAKLHSISLRPEAKQINHEIRILTSPDSNVDRIVTALSKAWKVPSTAVKTSIDSSPTPWPTPDVEGLFYADELVDLAAWLIVRDLFSPRGKSPFDAVPAEGHTRVDKSNTRPPLKAKDFPHQFKVSIVGLPYLAEKIERVEDLTQDATDKLIAFCESLITDEFKPEQLEIVTNTTTHKVMVVINMRVAATYIPTEQTVRDFLTPRLVPPAVIDQIVAV